jgi:hypothetical protein
MYNVVLMVLHSFQIMRRFDYPRYINFAMHLDIHHIVKAMYLEKLKYLLILNGGSNVEMLS